jgi:hypothetical protein
MVDFKQYWNSFFCWVDVEYKQAKQGVKKQAREGYKEYCKSIKQEPFWN